MGIKIKEKSSWIFHLSLLTLGLFLHDQQTLDLKIQSFFFLGNGQWLIDGNELWSRIIFYHGPKVLLAIFGSIHIYKIVYAKYKENKVLKDSIQIVLALAIVPLFVSFLKANTGIPCPHQLKHFGGEEPFFPIFSLIRGTRNCFPGGHASGGFALVTLWHLVGHKKNGKGLLLGLAVGWTMGLYQMMKGDHFLSHTLVSQEIAFLISLTLYQVLSKEQEKVI
ncbi:MAG: phosphatase PAP2 family protein [Bacteriovoracaceae bacterium]